MAPNWLSFKSHSYLTYYVDIPHCTPKIAGPNAVKHPHSVYPHLHH